MAAKPGQTVEEGGFPAVLTAAGAAPACQHQLWALLLPSVLSGTEGGTR